MTKICIKQPEICLGRDCRELPGNSSICCREEIIEEQEIVQNIIDTIDDFNKSKEDLQRISSKLSYGASIINKNGEEELIEILPAIKRFSLLIYECQDKIINDSIICDLAYSFTHELQKWFSYRFLGDLGASHHPVQAQSIIADISTIEMALGVCMLDTAEDDDIDDFFF